MTTLTKADLANHLFEELNVSKLVAKEIVDLLFEEMRQALERGEDLKISGFGNFQLRKKAARPGRNPKTGEPKIIEARKVVSFHTGHKLKALIEGTSIETTPDEGE